ncbi:hypothetical protein [Shinella sp. M27]|uniref:hypothetical protein n=1 Tax=Shinella sp. M27 TaxID=3368614 RepID=UPI003BA1E9C2
MNKAARAVHTGKIPPPTPLEDLEYAMRMLKEIHPKVASTDALLANLVDMAILQAIDLLSGRVPMQAKAPPQNGTISYKR